MSCDPEMLFFILRQPVGIGYFCLAVSYEEMQGQESSHDPRPEVRIRDRRLESEPSAIESRNACAVKLRAGTCHNNASHCILRAATT